MEQSHMTNWIIDLVIGGLVGLLIGAIVSVNIVIFLGPDEGYEASISDVIADNPLVGVLALGALVGGPAYGVLLARQRRRRGRDGSSSNENNARPFTSP